MPEEDPEEESVGALPSAGDSNSGIYFSILGILLITAGLTSLNRQKRKDIV